MDLNDRLKALSTRFQSLTDRIGTEEGTKQFLVLPFLNALGYDIHDPTEVDPEFAADVGVKKGEKVDYAIYHDGIPIILLECKPAKSTLKSSDVSQLFRYFTATNARFGILTNGILYRFYSDLDAPNKMDTEPFLEFDLFNFASRDAESLEWFAKGSFDLQDTLQAASDIKHTTLIKRFLSNQMNKPDEDFVSYVLRRVCPDSATKPDQEQFMRLLRESLRDLRRGRRARTTRTRRRKERQMTVVEHAVTVLEQERRSLSGTELARRIISRGYQSRSKDPVDTLRSIIWGETKRQTPRIVKDGKAYGLPE